MPLIRLKEILGIGTIGIGALCGTSPGFPKLVRFVFTVMLDVLLSTLFLSGNIFSHSSCKFTEAVRYIWRTSLLEENF